MTSQNDNLEKISSDIYLNSKIIANKYAIGKEEKPNKNLPKINTISENLSNEFDASKFSSETIEKENNILLRTGSVDRSILKKKRSDQNIKLKRVQFASECAQSERNENEFKKDCFKKYAVLNFNKKEDVLIDRLINSTKVISKNYPELLCEFKRNSANVKIRSERSNDNSKCNQNTDNVFNDHGISSATSKNHQKSEHNFAGFKNDYFKNSSAISKFNKNTGGTSHDKLIKSAENRSKNNQNIFKNEKNTNTISSTKNNVRRNSLELSLNQKSNEKRKLKSCRKSSFHRSLSLCSYLSAETNKNMRSLPKDKHKFFDVETIVSILDKDRENLIKGETPIIKLNLTAEKRRRESFDPSPKLYYPIARKDSFQANLENKNDLKNSDKDEYYFNDEISSDSNSESKCDSKPRFEFQSNDKFEWENSNLKEHQCQTWYNKVIHRGINISYDTLLKGLLTPTEYRLRKSYLTGQ